MADINECAHAACNCLVSQDGQFGKYCSEHCVEAAELIELRCDCKHPACRFAQDHPAAGDLASEQVLTD